MSVILNVPIDWQNHQHQIHQTIKTSDHYNDEEINHCLICDSLAANSGIPTREHYKHPKGCLCYWCVYCVCNEVRKREGG